MMVAKLVAVTCQPASSVSLGFEVVREGYRTFPFSYSNWPNRLLSDSARVG
ncbi:hypothetical protein BH24CHL1_BH24CHL1_14320 [soil metagenome]